jgi:hypothetical protein
VNAAAGYDFAFRCADSRHAGGRAPALFIHVERADGRPKPVLTLLDTGAALSVFDGRIARWSLDFDPRIHPIDVVPLAGLAAGHMRRGYVHEVSCLFGGSARFARLALHVAFTDPDEPAITANVLGREGLNGAQDRGFFSQVQFGYRHRVLGGPPEVYLTLSP